MNNKEQLKQFIKYLQKEKTTFSIIRQSIQINRDSITFELRNKIRNFNLSCFELDTTIIIY